jgi:uncharacterized protein YkwD
VVKRQSTRAGIQRSGRARIVGAVFCAALAVDGTAWAQAVATCCAALSREGVLRRLNELRINGAACGKVAVPATARPLTWNDTLAAAALQQAREMALLKRMSHRDRENRDLAERLRASGYRFSAAVENVAVGYPSFDDVVEAWIGSEGHCENVMHGGVLEFGVACVDATPADAPEEQRYWTIVLGAPARGR